MIQRDFVIRTIQQLAHTLAALLGGAKGRHLAETMERLDVISATFTGMDLPTLRSFSYRDLRALFSASGELAVERAFAAARVLHVEAELASERGAGFSREQALTALRLLAEATEALGGFTDDDHAEAFTSLHAALRGELPGEALEQVFGAARTAGRFDLAEDVLFEWIQLDTERRAQGAAESFYLELLGLPDDALERGRLPRDEVLEGMRELGMESPATTRPASREPGGGTR